jgi:hypothetical protein
MALYGENRRTQVAILRQLAQFIRMGLVMKRNIYLLLCGLMLVLSQQLWAQLVIKNSLGEGLVWVDQNSSVWMKGDLNLGQDAAGGIEGGELRLLASGTGTYLKNWYLDNYDNSFRLHVGTTAPHIYPLILSPEGQLALSYYKQDIGYGDSPLMARADGVVTNSGLINDHITNLNPTPNFVETTALNTKLMAPLLSMTVQKTGTYQVFAQFDLQAWIPDSPGTATTVGITAGLYRNGTDLVLSTTYTASLSAVLGYTDGATHNMRQTCFNSIIVDMIAGQTLNTGLVMWQGVNAHARLNYPNSHIHIIKLN